MIRLAREVKKAPENQVQESEVEDKARPSEPREPESEHWSNFYRRMEDFRQSVAQGREVQVTPDRNAGAHHVDCPLLPWQKNVTR